MAERKAVSRTYTVLDDSGNEETLALRFGPMSLGYIRENKELLTDVGQKSGFDDLVRQSVILPVALKSGMKDYAPDQSTLDKIEGEDIVDALLAALEASGFVFNRTAAPQGGNPSGEVSPTAA